MLGREALVLLSQLSQVISEVREETIFQVWEGVNGQIKIAVARSYSQIICGARLPSPLWEQEQVWDTELGIGLEG